VNERREEEEGREEEAVRKESRDGGKMMVAKQTRDSLSPLF
jgi:hypothetical protein